MKFKTTSVASDVLILANDHYTGTPYDLTDITANENGVIPAGTIIPANDGTAEGVLLTDVIPADNPNGTIVTHGAIDAAKLPEAPTSDAVAALGMIKFVGTQNTTTGSETTNTDTTTE